LSFDFGGTFIKYALVQENAAISSENKVPTPSSLEGLFVLVTDVIYDFESETFIEGIAISCPGTITQRGEIQGSSAIPYLYDIALKDLLEERTAKRVSIENDANCAALAELWKGTANGCHEAAVVVIGTGIGGAIIRNGRLYRGSNLYGG